MVRARICVGLPEGSWKADITREYGETTVCLSSTSVHDGYGIEIVTLSGKAIEACHRTVKRHEETRDATIVQRATDELTVQIETETPVLLSAAHRSKTSITYPITLRHEEAIIDIICSRERLSEFGETLDAAGLSYTVASIQADGEQCPVLTERQSEVLRLAVEQGYYETPRQCTLTELADTAGIAKSTCSGILKRIEAALVAEFLTTRSTPLPEWGWGTPSEKPVRS